MRYDTILFDADGTLLDFLRCEREAVAEAFSEMGVETDEEMLSEYSRINDSLWKKLERGEIEKSVLLYHRFELFYEKYGIVADPRRTADIYMKTLSQRAYLLDGAEELCKKLYGKTRMYIVTNGIKENQEKRLERCGLLKYMDGAFISECTGYEKPQTEFFQYVEARIPNFAKERTVIVGDSLSSDIKGGIGYGIDTCWYSPERKETPEDMRENISFIANSYAEIYEFLSGEGVR